VVTIEEIHRSGGAHPPARTPHPGDDLRQRGRRSGASVFLKCENLQRGGAFKIRGASNFIYSIPAVDLPRGVVAFSSGNHAQAVALAAQRIGTKATIVMPEDAPKSKVEGTRARGAQIVIYDRFKEDREAIGARIAADTGATLVPPYDHHWTIAGQGTAGLELLDEVPDLDALLVCVGGGGLIAGCAIAAKARRPSIRVFGVEPELANDTYLSMRAGERVEIAPPPTIADGLRSSQARRPDVPDHPGTRRVYSAGQRGGDSGGYAVPAAPNEDPGGAERGGCGGRRDEPQVPAGVATHRSGPVRRQCRFGPAGLDPSGAQG
jgi:threonine dehydratase